MKIGIKIPGFLKRKSSEVVSKTVSSKIGGDCQVKFTDLEFGVKDGKAYARINVEGEIDRSEFIKMIKMIAQDV